MLPAADTVPRMIPMRAWMSYLCRLKRRIANGLLIITSRKPNPPTMNAKRAAGTVAAERLNSDDVNAAPTMAAIVIPINPIAL